MTYHKMYLTKEETVAAAIQGDAARHNDTLLPWEATPDHMRLAFLSLAGHALGAAREWELEHQKRFTTNEDRV